MAFFAGCPEILFYEDEIVDRIKELIDEQQGLIIELKDSKRDELLCRALRMRPFQKPAVQPGPNPPTGLLTQMELDRVQYMLTAYMRTRIKKVGPLYFSYTSVTNTLSTHMYRLRSTSSTS